jgi:hypothetical protein
MTATVARLRLSAGLRPVALAGGLLLAAAPAHAELDPAKLAAEGQALLDNYVARSDGALQPKGKVTAIRDGDGVIVKVPSLAFVAPDTRIDVPGSAIRLEETAADHVAFAVTLPDTIAGTKTAPRPDKLLIQLGSHKIDGVYRPSLLTFGRLDALLQQVTVDTNDGSLSLDRLHVTGGSAEAAPAKWRSDFKMALGQLRVLGADKAPMISLGGFEQNWYLDQYDLPRMAAVQRELTGGASPFALMSEPDPEKAAALTQAWFARLPDLLEGASGGVGLRLADLQVTAPEEPPFALGRLSFDLGLAPDDALYGLQLALAVEEPRVDPMVSPVPPHLLPRHALADTGLRRLPLAPLWAALSAPMQEAMALEMAGKMTPEAEKELNQQMEMMPMAAMGMAAEAGSFAEIKRFELEFGPARITAHGVGPLMPGMPEPPLKIEAVIEGLEELVAEVQKLDQEMQQQAMPVLVMLRGLGKPAARNDKVVHTYLIEQTPEGAITVNGVSLEEMGKKPKN